MRDHSFLNQPRPGQARGIPSGPAPFTKPCEPPPCFGTQAGCRHPRPIICAPCSPGRALGGQQVSLHADSTACPLPFIPGVVPRGKPSPLTLLYDHTSLQACTTDCTELSTVIPNPQSPLFLNCRALETVTYNLQLWCVILINSLHQPRLLSQRVSFQ